MSPWWVLNAGKTTVMQSWTLCHYYRTAPFTGPSDRRARASGNLQRRQCQPAQVYERPARAGGGVEPTGQKGQEWNMNNEPLYGLTRLLFGTGTGGAEARSVGTRSNPRGRPACRRRNEKASNGSAARHSQVPLKERGAA